MPYFRSSFLNGLRDELWLTMTFQKMTLFHLLSLGIPAGGLGAGIGSGMRTHVVSATIIRGGIGLAVGMVIAWVLPRALWKMLWLLADKRWLLQPQPPAVPAMSREELFARLDASNWDQTLHAVGWIAAFMIGAIAIAAFGKLLDHVKAPDWLGICGLVSIGVFIGGFVLLERRSYRRLLAKHGLTCSNCGKEIARVGPCWHCGAAVVQDDPQ